jgi:putative nucleotidyltransferase with HDIG domain
METRVEFASTPKIFLTPVKRHAATVQANALGASLVLAPPFTTAQVEAGIKRFLGPAKRVWADRSETERLALSSATLVDSSILAAVAHDLPLPREEISASSSLIADSLTDIGISSWLEAVREHHSYTHRHCLTVSGLAVAFALHCGVCAPDVRRMAVCGLLHDVGKAKIPLSILDKPAQLTEEERSEINRHPDYGAQILIADNQFDAAIIDMTRHHHEHLDGSGYPDGLDGDQISNLVRMMTIVDIYSALIDQRAYKKALSANEAYEILEGMTGKIDMDILRAFKPVALDQVSGFSTKRLRHIG